MSDRFVLLTITCLKCSTNSAQTYTLCTDLLLDLVGGIPSLANAVSTYSAARSKAAGGKTT
jgi:hypothetical protein